MNSPRVGVATRQGHRARAAKNGNRRNSEVPAASQGENVEGSRSGVKPIYSPHDPVRQVEPTFGPPFEIGPENALKVETRVQIPLGLPIPTVAGCSAVLSHSLPGGCGR